MKDLRANDSLPQNENGLIRTRLEKGFMALLVAFMLFLPISQSKAGAVIGATEITQILNNVELIGIFGQEALHLAETIKQYQIMLQNLQKLPSIIETNATNALLSLANSTQVGMALTYAQANAGVQIDARFNNLTDYESFLATADLDSRAQRFQDVMQVTYDTVEGALEAANLQMSQFANEQTALDAIQTQMKTAVGQNQILQASGAIAAAQVEQMQKLRQLVMADINLQAEMAASAADEKAKEEAGWQKFATPSRVTDPTPNRMSLQEKLKRMRGD